MTDYSHLEPNHQAHLVTKLLRQQTAKFEELGFDRAAVDTAVLAFAIERIQAEAESDTGAVVAWLAGIAQALVGDGDAVGHA